MLATALLLSGCSKKTQTDTAKQTETQTVTESSTESESSSETAKETQAKSSTKETAKKKAESETAKEKESTSEKNRETQTDKESAASEKETKQSTGSSETVNSSEVHTVIGTLEELSMDQVVLLSDNELAFSTDDVKIDLPSGIRIGNLVSVDYTGKITQKGTEKATAVRITGSADVFKSDAETETEAATEKATEKATEQTTRKNKKSSEAATEAKTDESKAAETKADASKKQTVKGTLEKISMTGMTIKTSDGKELKFRIVQVPLYLEKGLTKGMSVKITYRGELQSEDSDQESVEVVRIQNAD